MLAVVLLVPIATALAAGANSGELRRPHAWFDSMRILRIPVGGGIRVFHLVFGIGVAAVGISLWQEVLPVFRRLRPDFSKAPPELVRAVRALPGWAKCEVAMTAERGFFLATSGRPARPRLILSPSVLERLAPEELEAVLRHENAHWRGRRWRAGQALFLSRMLQCYSPVALLAFRAYTLEVEYECDAEAAGRDPKVLARALLGVYRLLDRSDISGRAALRSRIEALLGHADPESRELSPAAIVVATAILLLILPWIV
jgi:Zn-dependent protease with chaperone function